ncbi:MAG TPA: hypothetical protein VHW96_10965 [Solirubrobacteraceae bacterium]|jgi:hypothetical protein|nr:hypothetical protein [Solirubrobacteraceae bacterium]
MVERPEGRPQDEEFEREREESTDLGYRDSEEERAYESAEQQGDKGTQDTDE